MFETIDAMKIGEAPGPDVIPIKYYKNLRSLAYILLKVFAGFILWGLYNSYF